MNKRLRRWAIAFAVGAGLFCSERSVEAAGNHLVGSADPYLLAHANNPVDWYPWGQEAFAKAKAEGKPIFLSIGYSTCYWCHVAERDLYSDPAIAALMNRWFVNIKVDREQRPDVDRFYIFATQILTQHGSWPNNLFLTPDGRPFYAGSYFPPKDDGDTPGFPTVLNAVHDLWINHRADQVEPTAVEVMVALNAIAQKQDASASQTPVRSMDWLGAAATKLLAGVDPVNGGFGSQNGGPKFPQAPALSLLATAAALNDDRKAGDALDLTLANMGAGGVNDQLAGGFFRYSTDPSWSVPHFEKMVSDNSQLLLIYADRAARTGSIQDKANAQQTADFLVGAMTLPDGGFATALDAASGGVEGATYLWTRHQIESVLGKAEADRFLKAYELTRLPDAEIAPDGDRPGVLRVRIPVAETMKRLQLTGPADLDGAFSSSRAKLLSVRQTRLQPARDDKLIVGTNGLAIRGLSRAATDLRRTDYCTAAKQASHRIWSEAYDQQTKQLQHQIFQHATGAAFLFDYASFGRGLLAVAACDVDHGAPWQAKARAIADAMMAHFAKKNGALADATGLLPVALEDSADDDTPAGASEALALLLELGRLNGGERFLDAAVRLSAHLAPQIDARPTAWPSAIVAMAQASPEERTRLDHAVAPAKAEPRATSVIHVPETADHVQVSATVSANGVSYDVVITIDPGFHINANVPSLDYLVATSVSFRAKPEAVRYPAPALFKPSFAAIALAVYEGTVHVAATLPAANEAAAGSRDQIELTAQACDAQTCLPPSTIKIAVKDRPSATPGDTSAIAPGEAQR